MTVVVTGGSRGIGHAIAAAFVHAGHTVVVGARTDSQELRALGDRVHFLSVDVRELSSHLRLVAEALEWTKQLDAYVNCAGFSRWSAVENVTEEFWDRMLDTNLKGTFWGCKAAAASLSSGGSIINVSSLAGKRGSANNSVYCASKFGITGLTQALAKELGVRGIRVNAVCPVLVDTPGLRAALAEPAAPPHGGYSDQFFKKFAEEQSALKRLPTAEEVANLCLWLASERASAITGQSINVDCGVLPQ